MAAKLTRLTHKIAIQLHLVGESCTICNSHSRWPVRKLLDTPSCVCNLFVYALLTHVFVYLFIMYVCMSTYICLLYVYVCVYICVHCLWYVYIYVSIDLCMELKTFKKLYFRVISPLSVRNSLLVVTIYAHKVNVKIFLYLIKHRVMKYPKVQLSFKAVCTTELDESEWSASLSSRFTPKERSPLHIG
jgi:hypothetical protein